MKASGHLVSYDDSIVLSCGIEEESYREKMKTAAIIEALEMKPFGIFSEDGGMEICALSTEKNIINLIENYHGKKILISKKRRSLEEIIKEDNLEQEFDKRRMKSISSDFNFSTRILNGPYASFFNNHTYFEITEDICGILNTCWSDHPQLKYFAAKLFTGAVLYREDTGMALLLTTVEVYGRTTSVDPHCEQPNVSYPPKSKKYNGVWPTSVESSDGLKLTIGTNVFNYLITGSVRVDKKCVAEVGPSTKQFVLNLHEDSKMTQMFINESVYNHAKSLGEDEDCQEIEKSHSLYQVRQLRSKFDQLQTYEKGRATFHEFNVLDHQPFSVFTLCNSQNKTTPVKGDDPAADYRLASKLLMEIAKVVLKYKYKSRLEKDVVESIMLQFTNSSRRIPKIVKNIMDMYVGRNEKMRILYNKQLNKELVELADILASYIHNANTTIIVNIEEKLKKLQL